MVTQQAASIKMEFLLHPLWTHIPSTDQCRTTTDCYIIPSIIPNPYFWEREKKRHMLSAWFSKVTIPYPPPFPLWIHPPLFTCISSCSSSFFCSISNLSLLLSASFRDFASSFRAFSACKFKILQSHIKSNTCIVYFKC